MALSGFPLKTVFFPLKPLKDELVVARSRFLAESIALSNGHHLHSNGQNGSNNGYFGRNMPIPSPKVARPKYSVPTVHTTLKQMEQAKLARQFEIQQQQKLKNNNNNNLDEPGMPTLKRSLSRTTSVGKLVNNFENGGSNRPTNSTQERDYFRAGQILPPKSPYKPPLAAKPSLRHTVSFIFETVFPKANVSLESPSFKLN